ncbi:hypothetical protein ACIQGZ_23035 [Streptomyces sp. NPDC092296]|uniref:hypothetical protein n=1 Tax=Streptomyces sp. NPDC092296 TaxID=3366012 RepID=UPI003817758C
MRLPAWLAEPLPLAGVVVLTAAGGGIGWRVHLLPGAGVGAVVGLLTAVALAALIERG